MILLACSCEEKSMFKRIIFNTSSQILAKAANVILGFLTVGLLTKYLGVNRYGIYTLAFAYLSFFGILADFGLQLTLVRELASKHTSDEIKSSYFSIKVFLTVFASIMALIVLLFFPYSIQVKTAIVIASFAVAVGYMNGYAASVFQSQVSLDKVALLEVINRISTVALIVIFVFLHWDLSAIILAILAGNLISLVLAAYWAPSYFRVKKLPKLSLVWDLIKVSFPIGVTSLLAVFYFKIDTLMLSVMKTTSDVGIYSLSYKIFENIIMVWLLYLASVYPLVSRFVKSKEHKKLGKIMKTSMLIGIFFSVATIIVSWISAPWVISVLGNKNFTESILPFRILVLSLPFVTINTLFYYVLLSISKIKGIALILLFSLVLNFIFNLLVIPTYGYVGTSVSTVITEMVIMLGYGLILLINRSKL